jgi:hypothetical protein
MTAAFPLFSTSTEHARAPSAPDAWTVPASAKALRSVPKTVTMTGMATLGTMATAIPLSDARGGGTASS